MQHIHHCLHTGQCSFKFDRNRFIEVTIIQVNRCHSSQLKVCTDMNESDIQLITTRPYQRAANKWYLAIAFRPGYSTDDTIAVRTDQSRIIARVFVTVHGSSAQWPPVINSRHVSRFGQVIPTTMSGRHRMWHSILSLSHASRRVPSLL